MDVLKEFKEPLLYILAACAIVGVLALVAGICYEFGSFWTWHALRWLCGMDA